MKASIDLGTNTCLLLIAEVDPKTGMATRAVEDHAKVVRLGQGVDKNHELASDAMERTLTCLKFYSERVKAQGLDPKSVIAVATSQARDSKNGPDFFRRVEAETGFHFRILTGDQEAIHTFVGGLLPSHDPKKSVVIDIGGGSTELMAATGGQSVDMGSVRFTERFLKSQPVTDPEFWACQEKIDSELTKLQGWRLGLGPSPALVAVAGTATTLAAWQLELKTFDASKIDGEVLYRGDIHRMVEELKWRTTAERETLPGVDPGRADVLLAGALILWRTMEVLEFPEVTISTRGLRYGVLGLDR